MSLTAELNEKYPIRPFLVFPGVRKKIVIEYAPEIEPALKQAIENGLHDLSLDGEVIQTITEIEILKISRQRDNVILKKSNGSVFHFEEKNPVSSILWTVYSVAVDNDWLSDLKDANILVRSFNIGGQRVSANIRCAIARKFQDLPDLYPLLKKTAVEATERFVNEVPLFSSQIVTDTGREFIQKTTGLFALKKNYKLAELASILYGEEKSFEAELTSYCQFLSTGSNRYKRELLHAEEVCINQFYKEPIFHLGDALANAKKQILTEYDYSDDLNNGKENLRSSRSVKSISPALLQSNFADINSDYQKAAKKMVVCHFIDELSNLLQKRIDGEFCHIIDCLRACMTEMGNYSVLKEADYGVKVHWSKGGELELEDYTFEDLSWSASDVQDAQINTYVPAGYINRVWFAGEEVCREVALNGSQYPVQQLKMLDKSMLCAIYVKDNTMMGQII